MKTLKQVEAIDCICEEQYQDLVITEAEYQGKTVKKSFRARHKCDTAKDKTSARYWSCYQWRANAPVNN